MEHEYDIFERFPDGSFIWRTVVAGYANAISRLEELAAGTRNEMRAIHLPSNAVVAAVNTPRQMNVERLSQNRTRVGREKTELLWTFRLIFS
jgi:hypothetical protein